MKTLFTIIFFIISNHIYAQEIKGQVLDYSTKLPISNVILNYGLQSLLTGNDGKFNLKKTASTNNLSIDKMGYETLNFSFAQLLTDTLTIYLKQSSVLLNDVNILARRNYQLDSINLRKDFSKVFAYQAPSIKDVFSEKGLEYKTFGSNLVSNSTSSILSFDVLKTISLFNKNKSSITKLKKVQIKEEEQRYVDNRFSTEKVETITGLTGDSLKNFIQEYKPTSVEIKKMSDYEVLMFIKKSNSEFILKNKH